MTDDSTLVNEQIADDEARYGKHAKLAQVFEMLARCTSLMVEHFRDIAEADEQDAQPTASANKIDPEAIGKAAAKRAWPEASSVWDKELARIVADEITKALAEADTAKEVDRPSLERRIYDYVNSYDHVRCGETALAEVAKAANEDEEAVRDLIHEAYYLGIDSCGCVYTIPGFADTADTTSLATTIRCQRATIARREKSIRRLMQNEGAAIVRAKELEATVRNVNATIDRRDKTIKRLDASIVKRAEFIVTPQQCKWWTEKICTEPSADRIPCPWARKTFDASTPVSDCNYFKAKEPANPPPDILSETDEGAMVGAVKMSVKDARAAKVCRICREPDTLIRLPDGTLDPFRYDFGAEYAHKSCLTQAAAETPQAPTGE